MLQLIKPIKPKLSFVIYDHLMASVDGPPQWRLYKVLPSVVLPSVHTVQFKCVDLHCHRSELSGAGAKQTEVTVSI